MQEATIRDILIKSSNYYTIRYTSLGDYDQVSEISITSLNLSRLLFIDSIYEWI